MSDQDPDQPPQPRVMSLAQYQQMQSMQAEEGKHRMVRFIESLDKEQLEALAILLHLCQHNDQTAAYQQGIVDSRLHILHNECMGCGTNHHEELGLDNADPAEGEAWMAQAKAEVDPAEAAADEAPVDAPMCHGDAFRHPQQSVPMERTPEVGKWVCPDCRTIADGPI